MKPSFFSLGFVSVALAASRTTAASGCVTVAKSGGQYFTVQSAVNSGNSCIFIAPGTYDEQVKVPASRSGLTIYGSTKDDTSYTSNTVTITHGLSQANGLGNEGTATLGIRGNGFKLYNVNVKNTYGEGSQAVALFSGVDSGFYGSAFFGFQDTVLSNEGSQVFVKCYVDGATDFIFGQKAKAWFEKVDIRVLNRPLGYITASGRDSESNPSYYVFNNCNIAAKSGQSVPAGAYYLGRPWRQYARVVFQSTSMTNVVNSQGWKIWNAGDERTCCVLFGEFNNSGDGSRGNRASFSKKLGSAVKIADVLGSGYAGQSWFDAKYFG